MIKKVLFIGVCIFAFASCSTVKPLYSWYNYEDITYQYSKKSTEELQVKVLEQYQKMIDKQKGASPTLTLQRKISLFSMFFVSETADNQFCVCR